MSDAAHALPPPDPRRLLCAAQLLAQDEPLSVAAAMAGLRPAALRALRGDPDFAELLADCRAIEAMPKQAQDERLLRYVRRAVERALANGRLGAIPSALRLLGILPSRAAGRAADDGDGADDEPSPELAAAAQARWGMVPDGEGGWATPDGRPAMPGRVVEVVAGGDGPARLLDEALPPDAAADFVAALDAHPDPETDVGFNQSAYPEGGLQWDRVTRTLWRWEGPPREERPAPEPAPLGDAAAAPAPPAPVAPSSPDLLRAHLDRLIASGAEPTDRDDLDLAEAVCSLLWPKWPRYVGCLDLGQVRLAIADRTIDQRTLHILGGSDAGVPAFPQDPPRKRDAPPAPSPSPEGEGREPDPEPIGAEGVCLPEPTPAKPRDGPPAPPAVRHARERHPGSPPPPDRTGLRLSREHGYYLERHGPWRA